MKLPSARTVRLILRDAFVIALINVALVIGIWWAAIDGYLNQW